MKNKLASLYSDTPAYNPNSSIQYAKINSNGTLGDFQIASETLNGTAYSYIFSDSEYIYVFGGVDQSYNVVNPVIALELSSTSGDIVSKSNLGVNFGDLGLEAKEELATIISNIVESSASIRENNIAKLNSNNYTNLKLNNYNQLIFTSGSKLAVTNSINMRTNVEVAYECR